MKKIAIVTGATRGIGLAVSHRLSQNGYFIVGLSKNLESSTINQWENNLENGGRLFKCNVTDAKDIENFLTNCDNIDGKIQVLVNNAGITRDVFFHKMSIDDWEDVIDTNLNSLFYITKPIFNKMRENGFGKIINISSVNGQKGQIGQVNYSTSKAGVHGFTMALALEGARYNIQVNTVSPGYTKTDMMENIKPEILNNIIEKIPLGRIATSEEIASVVSFLADDECSYITGANIPVNGGLFIG